MGLFGFGDGGNGEGARKDNGVGVVELPDIDPVAEAEVYAAYGRTEEARTLLTSSLSQEGDPAKRDRIMSALRAVDPEAAGRAVFGAPVVAGKSEEEPDEAKAGGDDGIGFKIVLAGLSALIQAHPGNAKLKDARNALEEALVVYLENGQDVGLLSQKRPRRHP